ncbi:MAG: nucleoside monophosphate kinase [Patescibacteria group bacterium]|nr:nucleoside monophosphate kinase [Patescibacteria group bacterium]
MPKNIIIFFGPPGSGKGTQAELLARKTGLPTGQAGWKKISTGDLLRAEIAAKTTLGKNVEKYLKTGKLVPDQMTIKLMENSLKQKAAGFIFDGFPRNSRQLKALLAILESLLKKNDQVRAIEVAVSDKEVKERLGLRRMCACGAVYHLKYNPPIAEGICDICHQELFTRNDDKPKVIAHRLKVYHQDGKPLLDYWQKQGKLIKINGEQPIKKIHEEIVEKLRGLKVI